MAVVGSDVEYVTVLAEIMAFELFPLVSTKTNQLVQKRRANTATMQNAVPEQQLCYKMQESTATNRLCNESTGNHFFELFTLKNKKN